MDTEHLAEHLIAAADADDVALPIVFFGAMGTMFTYELFSARPKTIGEIAILIVVSCLGWCITYRLVVSAIRKASDPQDSN